VQEGDAKKTVRVMLVEDQVPFRRSMAYLLGREPDLEVVAQAGSVDEARSHAASVVFDVVVVDLGLPDGDGVDLIAELRVASPDAAVLILSASLDPANFAKAEEAGADGVLDKFARPGEVVDAIRSLGKG
jgi:DNA-binding NarL/FixJ family response regulator